MRGLRILAISALLGIQVMVCDCTPLPLVDVPVCAWVEGQLCRAPYRAWRFGRDAQWEHDNLCPAGDLRFRSCYVLADIRNGWQLYIYRRGEE